jgi:hypothetical protein
MAHEGDVFADAEEFHVRFLKGAYFVVMPGFQIWPMLSEATLRREP